MRTFDWFEKNHINYVSLADLGRGLRGLQCPPPFGEKIIQKRSFLTILKAATLFLDRRVTWEAAPLFPKSLDPRMYMLHVSVCIYDLNHGCRNQMFIHVRDWYKENNVTWQQLHEREWSNSDNLHVLTIFVLLVIAVLDIGGIRERVAGVAPRLENLTQMSFFANFRFVPPFRTKLWTNVIERDVDWLEASAPGPSETYQVCTFLYNWVYNLYTSDQCTTSLPTNK